MKNPLTVAVAIGLAASSAQAAGPYDQPSRAIPYDDRGLYSDDGLADLHRRIRIAADQVCLDPTGPAPTATVNLVCRADALRSAQVQLAQAIARRRPQPAAFSNPR